MLPASSQRWVSMLTVLRCAGAEAAAALAKSTLVHPGSSPIESSCHPHPMLRTGHAHLPCGSDYRFACAGKQATFVTSGDRPNFRTTVRAERSLLSKRSRRGQYRNPFQPGSRSGRASALRAEACPEFVEGLRANGIAKRQPGRAVRITGTQNGALANPLASR